MGKTEKLRWHLYEIDESFSAHARATGLRVVRWRILKNWEPRSKGFDIEAEMNHRVERMGCKTVEIPINYRSRLGEKKLKLRHGFTILRRIISESL